MSSARFEPEDAIDPIAMFRYWYEKAAQTEANDPNAMALATSTVGGHPSVRMVLMKRLDDRGFSFYTNAESQKGHELRENPFAALCFHWKSLRRQIRVEGVVRELPPEDADAYFHSRSRQSQIGALASQQSRPLASREELERLAEEYDRQYPGEVPRPERIEFWEDGAFRLHNRIVFTRAGDAWERMRLFP